MKSSNHAAFERLACTRTYRFVAEFGIHIATRHPNGKWKHIGLTQSSCWTVSMQSLLANPWTYRSSADFMRSTWTHVQKSQHIGLLQSSTKPLINKNNYPAKVAKFVRFGSLTLYRQVTSGFRAQRPDRSAVPKKAATYRFDAEFVGALCRQNIEV